MTIPASAQSTAILPPNSSVPIINPKNGLLTVAGMNLIQQIQSLINGLTPTIACEATFASNVYTLDPLSISPQPNTNYYLDYVSFAFVAPANSTGPVTATIVPASGSLPTLPVYINNGATQANSGDITVYRQYTLTYVSSLGTEGGFVLR